MAMSSHRLAEIEPGQIVQTNLALEEFLDLDPDALDPPAFEYDGDGLVRRKMTPNSEHAALAFALSHLFGAYRDRTGRRLYGYVELRTNVGARSRLAGIALFTGSRPAEDDRKHVLTVATLSIEIRSPKQSLLEVRAKCASYLEHGGAVAMLVDPEQRALTVFHKGGLLSEQSYASDRATAPISELEDQFPAVDLPGSRCSPNSAPSTASTFGVLVSLIASFPASA